MRSRLFELALVLGTASACGDASPEAGGSTGAGSADGTGVATVTGPQTATSLPSSSSSTATTGTATSTTQGSTSTATTTTTATTTDEGDSSESSTGDPPAWACPDGPFAAPVAKGTAAALVADGFRGAEGVVWVPSESALFFSEIDRNRPPGISWQDDASAAILRLDPVAATTEVFVAAAGTNGLALSLAGDSLVGAAHGSQSISSWPLAGGAPSEVASAWEGGTFNSPNDLAIRADGSVYFSDPSWQQEGVDAGNPVAGTMRVFWVDPGGEVSVVDPDLTQPNGVSLSPEGDALYVSSVQPGALAPNWSGVSFIHRYDVAADGSVSGKALFAEPQGSFADGMAIDCAGNVYATTSLGVEVFSPTAEALAVIPVAATGLRASNAAFGGDDRQTLYLSVERNDDEPSARVFAIYSASVAVPGLPN